MDIHWTCNIEVTHVHFVREAILTVRLFSSQYKCLYLSNIGIWIFLVHFNYYISHEVYVFLTLFNILSIKNKGYPIVIRYSSYWSWNKTMTWSYASKASSNCRSSRVGKETFGTVSAWERMRRRVAIRAIEKLCFILVVFLSFWEKIYNVQKISFAVIKYQDLKGFTVFFHKEL